MPEHVAARAARDVDLPTTAAETRALESSSVFWLLVIGGLMTLLGGWLLPWFVEPTANGIGACLRHWRAPNSPSARFPALI